MEITKNANRSALCLVLLPALFVPFFSAVLYFIVFKESLAARIIYGAAKVFILLWPIIATKLILKKPVSFPLFVNERALYAGLVSGFLISALLLFLLNTSLGEIVFQNAAQIRDKAEKLGMIDHYILFCLFLAVFHSLLEEYYWRWFTYGNLKALIGNDLIAHIIAALCFALHHIVVTTQFFPITYGLVFGSFVGIGGFIWSKLYCHFGTLSSPWVSHIIVDLVILGVGYRLIFN